MPNPTIVEESVLSLADVKQAVADIEARDSELGVLSQKCKEYLDVFVTISIEDKNTLLEGLKALDLTRLKEEHMMKIIDFLPQDAEELKAVLQAYPLTLSKKDQDAIIAEVKKVA